VAAVGLLSSVALGLSRELGLCTLQGEGASQLSPFWSLGLHAIAGENHTTLCSMHAGKVLGIILGDSQTSGELKNEQMVWNGGELWFSGQKSP